MKQLILSSSSDGHYRLTGATDELTQNKRARMMIRSQLQYESDADGLTIKSDKEIEQIAAILKIVAGYIGANVVYDDKIDTDIRDFKEQEEQFELFSKKARDIKNNNCDPTEFKQFTDVLHQYMPYRHLYELQLLSAYHLAFSQNGCNFSVPGAGKTSIVYGAYTFLKNRPADDPKYVDKLLIIGPLSSFGPWENEYEECFGVKADSMRLASSLGINARKQYFYGVTAELTLISYASVPSLKNEIEYFLRNNRVMVVLDEAHKVKNTSGGVTASSMMDLAKWCASRVVLTGTPAPNGYEDLYNLFHFIWPQNDVIKYNVGQLRDMSKTDGDSRVEKVMDNISPYFIRIRKDDLHLPDATENAPIIVPMKDSQRRIYDFVEQRFIEEANRETSESELHNVLVKAKMIRLQQVATNPALLSSPLSSFSSEYGEDLSSVEAEDASIMRDIMRFYDENVPAKYEECLKLVRQIIERGEKVIVWVIFIKNIESLSEYLRANGIECRILYGATPVATEDMNEEAYAETREAIVKEFHKQDSPFRVIIANPFAVAESISLHKACHNAIYLERSFNCAHYMQSKDRIHRYGLPKDTETNYYYILSEDSVDETIDSRLRVKEQRMLEMIESMPIPLFKNLTDEGDEDIKAILTDYVKRKARKAF
ncbi:MAG: DEAD/DEAH box helicase [Bacteroidaceae bacterium]|nr:DEAD/DEAH box helicase [Bacteroidaceae bacterium]